MFPKKKRLTTEELGVVLKKGRNRNASFVYVKKYPVQGETKVAAIAPKKVANGAVGRNKVRRRIYNALREISLPPHDHIAVFAKPTIHDASFEELVEDLKSLLE